MSAQNGVFTSGHWNFKLWRLATRCGRARAAPLGAAPAYPEPIRSAQHEERALDLASRHRDKAAPLLEMRPPQVASSTNDEGGMTKERQNPDGEKKCPVAPFLIQAFDQVFALSSFEHSDFLRHSLFVLRHFVGHTRASGVPCSK